MAAAAAAAAAPATESDASSPQSLRAGPRVATTLDSKALRSQAERFEVESESLVLDPALLLVLEGLLQEIYASLQPKPIDYEHRNVMIDVFNKIAGQIFGKKNGLPVVEPFGSFTMDLFTPKSDLDLSVNFNTDANDWFPRKDKISAIRRLAKVLQTHQRKGLVYGVLPIVTARVPVLKVTDQGTGVECDISVENKDGMSRSLIFKFISSIDDRFRKLCFLMKFWAKAHDVNSPKDRTMSSMAIISLVAFHLQTRRPPILPAFYSILKDGSDIASIERNVWQFKDFGSRNKESIAELFVSLMSKLVSVEGLWEQGLCASNFDGFWISKTWERGVANLSVEDFLDRSQNFARSVGEDEMERICECIRVTVSNLREFFMGEIDAPKLKAFLFAPVIQHKPVSIASAETAKRKGLNQIKAITKRKVKIVTRKRKVVKRKNAMTNPGKEGVKRKNTDQDKPVASPTQQDAAKKSNLGSGSSHAQQKKAKRSVDTGRAANVPVSRSRHPIVSVHHQMHQPVTHFEHIPQPVIMPPARAYGFSGPHFHPSGHPHQGQVGLPQGNFFHLDPGMQLQHQGQFMFPPTAQYPVLDRFHPYGINGAQQPWQRNDHRFGQWPPYGTGPGFWR